jgi:hypothetical protein
MSILEKYGVVREEDLSRDVGQKDTDRAAVRAIAQAAVNVELFTIPLYMVAMYSIEGTHQITGANAFYEGRWWPGRAPVPEAAKDDSKAQAFNLTFKVFIEEMLHLQLAANLCKVIGVDPRFTELSPPSLAYAWHCYDDKPEIPFILDFRDTVAGYSDLRVKLGAMNDEQVRLFLAIEETQEDAEKHIRPECLSKYFPDVPFKGWQPGDPLPLFGSIGAMYLCLWKYLNLRYADGTSLWQFVKAPGEPQRDLFNSTSAGHPKPEYPGFKATLDTASGVPVLFEIMRIINAITDQGEGKGVVRIMKEVFQRVAQPQLQKTNAPALTAVSKPYQADYDALLADYKSYSDTGQPRAVSGDAYARGSMPNRQLDHFEAFSAVRKLLAAPDFETWDTWHQKGKRWTAAMLEPDPKRHSKYPIPPADSIASALNALKDDSGGKNYRVLSQAAAGAIAGITRVLDDYWQTQSTEFPFPSMSGSGDRVSICWAVFGKPPNLALGIEARQPGVLYHACQGLALAAKPAPSDACASVAVYHTCKGSNGCKAEGGCGFVQSASGGGNCSQTAKVGFGSGCGLCGGGKGGSPYSAPSDNRCGGFGGCAVPISASQLFPAPADGKAVMNVYDFVAPGDEPKLLTTIEYAEGEPVYDVAWKAYLEVLQHRKVSPLPEKPKPSLLRLAFPPST